MRGRCGSAAGLKARSDTARIAGERGIVTDRPA